MSDLVYCTATELARMIREREVSSLEVVEAFLDQIERHNPALNAIVTLDAEGARQRAREADAALQKGEVWGPLHGLPVTIKDTFETAGLRTTAGYRPLKDYVPRQDATVVARLRAAGVVILGKTNTPELGVDIQTNGRLWGRANNPWNVGHTTGGSSGGEAAALAAGMTPLGVGSDLAGSIRLPSHDCGVFGLKATRNRISGLGHVPPLPGRAPTTRHMISFGPMARSVADLRLCLSLIAGPDEGMADIPPVPLAETPGRSLNPLRIAWTDGFGDLPVTQDTRAALAKLAADLSAAGHHVERKKPPDFDFEDVWRTYGEVLGFVVAPELGLQLRYGFRFFGRAIFQDRIMRAASSVATLPVPRLLAALAERDRLAGILERFLADYDAWLCPVACVPAFPHCRRGPRGAPIDVDGQKLPYWAATISYVCAFNLTGHPVVVMPIAQSSDGLPIGVQVVGRHWSEMDLLNTAEKLTEVSGPFRRPPGF